MGASMCCGQARPGWQPEHATTAKGAGFAARRKASLGGIVRDGLKLRPKPYATMTRVPASLQAEISVSGSAPPQTTVSSSDSCPIATPAARPIFA